MRAPLRCSVHPLRHLVILAKHSPGLLCVSSLTLKRSDEILIAIILYCRLYGGSLQFINGFCMHKSVNPVIRELLKGSDALDDWDDEYFRAC